MAPSNNEYNFFLLLFRLEISIFSCEGENFNIVIEIGLTDDVSFDINDVTFI